MTYIGQFGSVGQVLPAWLPLMDGRLHEPDYAKDGTSCMVHKIKMVQQPYAYRTRHLSTSPTPRLTMENPETPETRNMGHYLARLQCPQVISPP